MKDEKHIIIFTDSGDTIMDEATQKFDADGYVTESDFIEDAKEVYEKLYREGYRICLVADGEEKSFQNIYGKAGTKYWFEGWVVSETVGEQKPSVKMFDAAMGAMHLGKEDLDRIVMIGNNLKKDVAGANRYGITSIWESWSPRYFHTVEEADWKPDYTIAHIRELPDLIEKLEADYRKREK